MPTVRTKHGDLEFIDPPWVPTGEEMATFLRTHADDFEGADLLTRLVRAHRMRVDQLIELSDTLVSVVELSALRKAIALAALAAAGMELSGLPEEYRTALESHEIPPRAKAPKGH